MERQDSNSILYKKLERQKTIHDKGFSMTRHEDVLIDNRVLDYSKVKLGNGPVKPVSDAVVNLETALTRLGTTYTDKDEILRAIQENDLTTLREVSDFYFNTNGFYNLNLLFLW